MMWTLDNGTASYDNGSGYALTTIIYSNNSLDEPAWRTKTPREVATAELAVLVEKLGRSVERFGRHALRMARMLDLWYARLARETATIFREGTPAPLKLPRAPGPRAGRTCALSSAWRLARAPP